MRICIDLLIIGMCINIIKMYVYQLSGKKIVIQFFLQPFSIRNSCFTPELSQMDVEPE